MRNACGAGKPVSENQMHVHVPQPGNQEQAAAVHARRISRILRRLACPHQKNVLAFEDYGLLGLQSAGSNVNNGHIVEHQQIGRSRFLPVKERGEK